MPPHFCNKNTLHLCLVVKVSKSVYHFHASPLPKILDPLLISSGTRYSYCCPFRYWHKSPICNKLKHQEGCLEVLFVLKSVRVHLAHSKPVVLYILLTLTWRLFSPSSWVLFSLLPEFSLTWRLFSPSSWVLISKCYKCSCQYMVSGVGFTCNPYY